MPGVFGNNTYMGLMLRITSSTTILYINFLALQISQYTGIECFKLFYRNRAIYFSPPDIFLTWWLFNDKLIFRGPSCVLSCSYTPALSEIICLPFWKWCVRKAEEWIGSSEFFLSFWARGFLNLLYALKHFAALTRFLYDKALSDRNPLMWKSFPLPEGRFINNGLFYHTN